MVTQAGGLGIAVQIDHTEEEQVRALFAFKNVSINEPFFQGHFPGFPVMPGVLIVEAMAQVGGVAMLSVPDFKGKIAFLAGIDGARFRRQVVPGDQLRIEVSITKLKGVIGKGQAVAYVDGELAAEAELTFPIKKD